MVRRILAIAFALGACSGDDGGVQTGGSSSTASTTGNSAGSSSEGGTSSTTMPVSTTTSVDSTAASSSSEGGSTFDLGAQPDVGAPRRGCTAVDFLFVVDDSSSMSANQTNLIDNFPTFIAGIESTLGAVDSYHVGVIATDAFAGNPGQCILLGALITETTGAGVDSSNAVCGPYAEGLGYMTEADDLDATFACAAQVGTMGNGFERPMEAMTTALGPTLSGMGQCNEGFLRDDALLVIVVITDEWDGPGDPEDTGGQREPATSAGDPQSWHDDVVAAKGGHEENVAALAITNYADGPCPPIDTGHDGQNIVDWVTLFGDHGFLGGICLNDYGPFFGDAVDVVAQACADFVPAG